MPGVDHSVLDVGNAHSDWKQLENSAINRIATSDNKEECSLYKQSIFAIAHILLKRATEL